MLRIQDEVVEEIKYEIIGGIKGALHEVSRNEIVI